MDLPASAPEAYEAAILAALPQLDPSALQPLAAYLRLVDEYSPLLNLTGYRGAKELAEEYVFTAAQISAMQPLAESGRGADLGSGAGCPVVALAILHPGWRFTAIESRQRRSDFLGLVRAKLGLGNLTVLCERTERLILREPGSYDLVSARAYARPAVLMGHAAALLKSGGELRAVVGQEVPGLSEAAAAADMLLRQDVLMEHGIRGWRLLRAQRI